MIDKHLLAPVSAREGQASIVRMHRIVRVNSLISNKIKFIYLFIYSIFTALDKDIAVGKD